MNNEYITSYFDSIFNMGNKYNENISDNFIKEDKIMTNDRDITFLKNNNNEIFLTNPSLKNVVSSYNGQFYNKYNYDELTSPFYPIVNEGKINWLDINENISKLKVLNNSNRDISTTNQVRNLESSDIKLEIDGCSKEITKAGLYIFKIKYKDDFSYYDYEFELRINGMPTKLFTVVNNITDDENYILLTFDPGKFYKATGLTNIDYIFLRVTNLYNYEHYEGMLLNYINNMPPFISYDKMVESDEDIIINFRFDVSVTTKTLTNNIDINISRDYFDINNPIDYLKFSDKKIFLSSQKEKIITIYNTDTSGKVYYLLGKDNIIFNNEYFKTISISYIKDLTKPSEIDIYNDNLEDCLFDNGKLKVFVFKPNSKLMIKIKAENLKEDYKDKITFKFLRMKEGLSYNNINDFKEKNIRNSVVVNIDTEIYAPKKNIFTEDENEILNHILTFDKGEITATYNSIEGFSFTANNNVIVNENSANRDEIKDYISNGGDLSNIDSMFKDYDLTCYGVIIDYMTLSNPNVGIIKMERLNMLEDIDEQDGSGYVTVCNQDNNDNYKNGFNSESMIITEGNNRFRKFMVHDTVFNLFNFCNKNKKMDKDNVTIIIDDKNCDEIKTIPINNYESFMFHPTMNFNLLTNSQNFEVNTTTSKLFVDYYPAKFRFCKRTESKKIIWTLHPVDISSEIHQEKILDIFVLEKEDPNEDEDKSNGEIKEGTINDTDSLIVYPEFIDLNIAIKSTKGVLDEIGLAECDAQIKYSVNEKPILIEVVKPAYICYPNEMLDYKGEFDGFLNCKFNSNPEEIKILEDGVYKKINGYLLNAGETLDLKFYNSTNILVDVPKEFGKIAENIQSQVECIIHYLDKNENEDYIFRKNYPENVNMNFLITAIPLLDSGNVDSDIMKEDITTININTELIERRDIVFLFLKNEDDILNTVTDSSIIDDIISNENNDTKEIIVKRNITRFDMKDILELESGIDFSFLDIKNQLLSKFTDENINVYGIECIARTIYNGDEVYYDSVVITNFFDKYHLNDDQKPRLNRINGSLVHSISIINKKEESFDYKIIVDDKERPEGYILSNYTNEMSLHKFRLYYKLKESDNWILSDSFEGVIDGTRPLQPKFYIEDENENIKILPKYPLISRNDAFTLLKDFNHILSEYSYYNRKVNLIVGKNITLDGEFSQRYITIKGYKYQDQICIKPTDKLYGIFTIENNSDEKVRCQIVPDNNIVNNLIITTSLLDSNIMNVNPSLQPIYILPPNSLTTVYVLRKNKEFSSGTIEVRFENNINPITNSNYSFKPFSAEDIYWICHEIIVLGDYDSPYNELILKELTPYMFYNISKSIDNTEKRKIAEYYPATQNDLENIIDFTNFNKNYLYRVQVYLDDILLLDSNKKISEENESPLLISENRLKYLLTNGQHNVLIITSKYNGLDNYNNYYFTINDRNIYIKNEEKYENKNYYKGIDDSNLDRRNKLVLRNPVNEDLKYENELFMDTLGHISIVQKDEISKNKESVNYLYNITENIRNYMNFSKYLVESNNILCETLNQKVYYYKNFIKENYNYFSKNGEKKLVEEGELDKIISSIKNYFDFFDKTLKEIEEVEYVDSETKKDDPFEIDNPVLYIEDNIQSNYKTIIGPDLTYKSYITRKIHFVGNYFEGNEIDSNGDLYISIGDNNIEEIKNSISFKIINKNNNEKNINISELLDINKFYDNIFEFSFNRTSSYLKDKEKVKIALDIKIGKVNVRYFYILENLDKLVIFDKDNNTEFNIFTNTYKEKSVTITNNSSFDLNFTMASNDAFTEELSFSKLNIFPENFVVFNMEEFISDIKNVNLDLILKSGKTGKIHFKRNIDNENQISPPVCYSFKIHCNFKSDSNYHNKNYINTITNFVDYNQDYNEISDIFVRTYCINLFKFNGISLKEVWENNLSINDINFEGNTDIYLINDTTELLYGSILKSNNIIINEQKNLQKGNNIDNSKIYNHYILTPLPINDLNLNSSYIKLSLNENCKDEYISISVSKNEYYENFVSNSESDSFEGFNSHYNLYKQDSHFDNSGINNILNIPSPALYEFDDTYLIEVNDTKEKRLFNFRFVEQIYNETDFEIVFTDIFYQDDKIKMYSMPKLFYDYKLFIPYLNQDIYTPDSESIEEPFLFGDGKDYKNEETFELAKKVFDIEGDLNSFTFNQNNLFNKIYSDSEKKYPNTFKNGTIPYSKIGETSLDYFEIVIDIPYAFYNYSGFYILSKIYNNYNDRPSNGKFYFRKNLIPLDDITILKGIEEEAIVDKYEITSTNIGQIQSILSSNFINKTKDNLKEAFNEIQEIISLEGLIQHNLNLQKEIIKKKATVVEYKNFLSVNTKKINEYIYKINELMNAISINNIPEVTMFIEGNENNKQIFNLNSKIPIFYNDSQSKIRYIYETNSSNTINSINEINVTFIRNDNDIIKNISLMYLTEQINFFNTIDDYNYYEVKNTSFFYRFSKDNFNNELDNFNWT